MKKSFLLAVVLLAFNSLFANPVDANLAKELGQKFVSANFVQKSNSLQLVYTENSELGEPCFYVFNVSDHGFIIVSAEDNTRPILGYSENGAFDANNIVPGLGFMMDIYKESISYAKENNIAPTMGIASEWKSLETTGKTKPAMRGQSVEPLCTTKLQDRIQIVAVDMKKGIEVTQPISISFEYPSYKAYKVKLLELKLHLLGHSEP